MDLKNILNKNLYLVLNIDKNSELKIIKSSFYALSKKLHPDVNPNIKENILFQEISEAWSVLGDESLKSEYDKKSKFGKDYDEFEELFIVNMEYNHKEAERVYDDIKNREVLDVVVVIDKNDFNGTLEFIRWVICPTCKGNGKDMSTKIEIKGLDGKSRWFEADDGCDRCEGIGKFPNGEDCTFCNGHGKVGINSCKKCNGDQRIQGKQKIKDIKLSENETKIESMGHWNRGRVGNLIIKYNN